jgi:hypothetical protein
MRRLAIAASLALCASVHAAQSPDPRASALVTLDGEHAWKFEGDAKAWGVESERIRRQVQVSAGLWPMPERGPVRAIVRGEVDRGEYKVQAILLETVPGFFVGGSLYLPAKRAERAPAVLCPHGHWTDGRFCRRGDNEVAAEVASGAETNADSARFHLQARCVQLARMGCIVFFYDMVGVADTKQLGHGEGFTDLESILWGESAFGLQTWDSLRVLDWLAARPDVDPARIGVTGESGGGTQTFILCALDPRPAVAFPAVMVSTEMQGGCVCENAPQLRIGINNVAIAALTAPRPMELSGANDWTLHIETHGLPELKAVYKALGAEEKVAAHCWPQFGHNYNLLAREEMERWFDKYLKLGAGADVHEKPFTPIEPTELTALGSRGALPEGAKSGDEIRASLRAAAAERFKALIPKSKADVERYRAVVEPALEVLLHTSLASIEPVTCVKAADKPDVITFNASDGGPPVVATLLAPAKPSGTMCIVASGRGRDGLADTLNEGLRHGVTYVLPRQLFDEDGSANGFFAKDEATSKLAKLRVDERHGSYAGYTWCYNRVLIAERARDVLVAIAGARKIEGTKRVVLWGEGRAGPRALLAAALGRRYLDAVLVDEKWEIADFKSLDDPDMLPGALRYGGLDGFAALVLPVELQIASHDRGDWPATAAMQGIPGKGLSFSDLSSSMLIQSLVEQH